MMKRNIITIDEEKCIGCGLCANACHEGAIEIVDGKARLIREDYCDGLGNCLPACPTEAITIEQREAEEYNKEVAPKRVAAKLEKEKEIEEKRSELMQWPVQIKLAPITAEHYQNANILIAADCAAYAHGNFHNDFMKNRITLIGCPKLDSVDYTEKLTEIFANNEIGSIVLTRMEVPCCGGIERAVKEAIDMSGKIIPFKLVTLSRTGEIV